MEELTINKIKEYRDAFELFDKDKDGSITSDELLDVLKCLSSHDNENLFREIIKEVDTDGNGRIDFEEFVVLIHRRKKDILSEEDLRNAFRVLDKDGDKLISNEELKYLLSTLGENMTEEEVDEIIKDIDQDSDGYINYEEFVDIIVNDKSSSNANNQ